MSKSLAALASRKLALQQSCAASRLRVREQIDRLRDVRGAAPNPDAAQHLRVWPRVLFELALSRLGLQGAATLVGWFGRIVLLARLTQRIWGREPAPAQAAAGPARRQ